MSKTFIVRAPTGGGRATLTVPLTSAMSEVSLHGDCRDREREKKGCYRFLPFSLSFSLSLLSNTLCLSLSQVHAKACALFELAPVSNFMLKSGRNVVSLADSVRLSKYPNRATLDLTKANAPLGLSADGTCALDTSRALFPERSRLVGRRRATV